MPRRTVPALAAVLVLAGPAGADSPLPPTTYTAVSPGGEFVFVMISPLSPADELRHWTGDTAESIRRIRGTYSRSGLYYNDGSADPLWTVDWYGRVEVSSDGVHLIRHGPWATSTESEAVAFFARNELLRSYRVKDLVDNPLELKRTVSHINWQEDSRYDDAAREYAVTTVDGNTFVFDTRTGDIVSKHRPARRWVCAGSAVFALLGIAVVRRAVSRRTAVR